MAYTNLKTICTAVLFVLLSTKAMADISEGSFTPQGNLRFPPVSEDAVEIFVYKPDFKFKVIGVIEARGMAEYSESLLEQADVLGKFLFPKKMPTEKDDIDLATKALKREAAKAGAHGVIILKTQQVRVSENSTERQIKGAAIVKEVEISDKKITPEQSAEIKKEQSIKDKIIEINQKQKILCESEDFKVITEKSPCNIADASLSQLSNTLKISKSEKSIFEKLHSEQSALRRQMIETLRQSGVQKNKELADVLEKASAALDSSVLSVYESKSSWGDYNKARREISLKMKEGIRDVSNNKQ